MSGFVFNFFFNIFFKGIIYPKMKVLSLFTLFTLVLIQACMFFLHLWNTVEYFFLRHVSYMCFLSIQ